MPDEKGADVSRETFCRLRAFELHLLKWNSRINLVGPHELAHFWDRHIAESLVLTRRLPTSGPVVDLGSGPGFPGLVIALATGRHVTLIEADKRKATFLREVARETGAHVSVIADRIERSGVAGAGIITARALAPMPRLLDLAAPLLAENGTCFFIKGVRVGSELTKARRQWQMEVRRHPTHENGCIIEVTHLLRVEAARA